jgi:hypothetical protein
MLNCILEDNKTVCGQDCTVSRWFSARLCFHSSREFLDSVFKKYHAACHHFSSFEHGQLTLKKK